MSISTHPLGERVAGGPQLATREPVGAPPVEVCQLCDGTLDLSTATAFVYWANSRSLVHEDCLIEHRRTR
jgi:hypothetical protein